MARPHQPGPLPTPSGVRGFPSCWPSSPPLDDAESRAGSSLPPEALLLLPPASPASLGLRAAGQILDRGPGPTPTQQGLRSGPGTGPGAGSPGRAGKADVRTQPLTTRGPVLVLTRGVVKSALNGQGQRISTAQVGVIREGRSPPCPSPPAPAGQLSMPERQLVPARWQRRAALETQRAGCSAHCARSECQVFLSGSIFSPFPNCLSCRGRSQANTEHPSPHTRADGPDRP